MEIPLVRPPKSRNIKAKKVILSSGKEIGAHTADSCEEIIIVLRGAATVIAAGRRSKLGPGEARFIPEGTRHNVRNDTDSELEYVYVVSRLPGRPQKSH